VARHVEGIDGPAGASPHGHLASGEITGFIDCHATKGTLGPAQDVFSEELGFHESFSLLQVEVNAAALLIVLEIHDIKILTSGSELNLPLAEPGPCKLATNHTIPGVQLDQFGDDFPIEQIPDVFLVLFVELGLLSFRHGNSLGMEKRGYSRLT
jgi:hypothetical protein